MKKTIQIFLPPILALLGLFGCCLLLWSQTDRFRRSVEKIAEDVRVSLIDLDGKVVYDSAGQDLPNHSDRAEFESVRDNGRPLSVVRESETLHMSMLYHARRVGNYVLRIAVPYQSVTDAKAYATSGLLAAIGIGALIVLALFFFTRRYEQRLSRLAAERDMQDRLLAEMRALEEFRREFVSNVTHEIKTPVTGILGAAEILADETSGIDESDRRQLQSVIKNQSVRLNALVEDILSLARLERAEAKREAKFVQGNIVDIVETAINLARPLSAKANIEITLDAPQAVVRPCEPKLVESAVSNLIQNAIRYSGSSKIEIRVCADRSGRALVCVADHGIGIPAECQPRLFERFYRVDKDRSRAAGGTGLGLAIVKHVAQLHGGEVSVRSAPGEGAEFTFSV